MRQGEVTNVCTRAAIAIPPRHISDPRTKVIGYFSEGKVGHDG